MDHITSQEAAEKWGLSKRSVQLYCQNGKIAGAVNVGKQWLIPANTEKPLDTRFVKNRRTQESETYHFPIFVYTKYFVSRSELSEDELLLLDAQILNIKCEYAESVRICKKLIGDTVSTSVRFGAYFTNVVNYMFLGLASEIPFCINQLESIYKSTTAHQEDYRLILAFYYHTYRFDHSHYSMINASKLSFDALITYKIMSFTVSVFSETDLPENSVRIFEAELRETELIGITPAALVMHGVIGMLYSRRGNMDAKLCHIDQACRIGYESGFVRLLTKCSSLDIDTFVLCLSKYSSSHANELRERVTRNRNCCQLSYKFMCGENQLYDIDLFEAEIMLLLVYKTPIRDIAALKNISENEVRKTVDGLCRQLSLNSKKELLELFKATYCSVPD